MGDENVCDRTTPSSETRSENANLHMQKAFDKVARLFKTNGIIYGNSVCNSSIKGGSSNKENKDA